MVLVKVGFITPQYPNISTRGGALYAENLTETLSNYVDIDVILPSINARKLENNLIKYILVKRSQKPILKTISFLLNVNKKIESKRYDIIHTNGIGGLFLDKVDVVTIHHLPDNLKGRMHFIPSCLESRKARKIVTVSNYTKRELLKDPFLKNSDVVTIPNGIDPVFLQEKNEDKMEKLKEELGLVGRKAILSINSTFTKRKNFRLMLETAKFISRFREDCKILMIGPQAKEKYAKKLFKKSGLKEMFIYESSVSQDLMPYYYAISDFLAMPSTKEGFGLPLIEAVGTRTPFVSFPVGIAPELKEEGFGKVVKNKNDFKKECVKMLEEPSKPSRRGKKFIKNNFSWKKTSKRLMKTYRNLL